jgi:hypothetical protein
MHYSPGIWPKTKGAELARFLLSFPPPLRPLRLLPTPQPAQPSLTEPMGGHDSRNPSTETPTSLHSRQELRQDRADASLLGPLRLIAQNWLDAAGSDLVWVEVRLA